MQQIRQSHFIFFSLLIASVFSCSVNKAKIDNELKTYYDEAGTKGCFTMLDNASGEVTVYNMNWDTTRFAPGATFDIFSGLVLLETGLVPDAIMKFSLPGLTTDTIQQADSSDMISAFHQTNSLFFNHIISKSGKDTLKYWVDSVSYGNKSFNINDSLNFSQGNLKISPDEQLGLLKRLYFGQLPFRKSVQESICNMMVKEDNTQFKLSYKTGMTDAVGNGAMAWSIGWIEENKHVYFFVNLIESNGIDAEQKSVDVTKKILDHYGFFKGRK